MVNELAGRSLRRLYTLPSCVSEAVVVKHLLMFQPPSAHHTHSFLLKASLTFNALQVDLLDRSGRLLRLFEAALHVADEGAPRRRP